MKYVKAALVGALGSLVMWVLYQTLVLTGWGTFNAAPPTSWVEAFNWEIPFLDFVLHIVYGMICGIGYLAVFRRAMNIPTGLLYSVAVWLTLALGVAPIVGHGFFGIGGVNHTLDPSAPLYIGSGIVYSFSTLIVHFFYGLTLGWLTPKWVRHPEPENMVTGDPEKVVG